MKNLQIDFPLEEIKTFCAKWKIKEFSLFGSVLREDFDKQSSDIDILIEFLPDASWGWDIVNMNEELSVIFNRKVDVVNKLSVQRSRNPIRKKAILDSYEVLYEQVA